jgi:hypothetical protein
LVGFKSRSLKACAAQPAIDFVPIGLRLIHGCGSLLLCDMFFGFFDRAGS